MRCEQYFEILPLYVSGDLTGNERAGLEQHLSECARCRAELDKLSEVARMLAPSDDDTLSEVEKLRLENDILRRLVCEGKTESVPRRSSVTSLIVRIAVAAAIFIVGFSVRPLLPVNNQTQPVTRATLTDLAEHGSDLTTGMRFSKQGFRLIARGKSGLIN